MDTQLEQPSFIEKGVTHVSRESKGRGHEKFFFFYNHIKYYYKATFYYTLNNYATLQDDAMGAKINVNTIPWP